jgi:hypothetical protein
MCHCLKAQFSIIHSPFWAYTSPHLLPYGCLPLALVKIIHTSEILNTHVKWIIQKRIYDLLSNMQWIQIKRIKIKLLNFQSSVIRNVMSNKFSCYNNRRQYCKTSGVDMDWNQGKITRRGGIHLRTFRFYPEIIIIPSTSHNSLAFI